MSNPLFSALGGNNSIMSMLQQLKSNPAVYRSVIRKLQK